MLRIIRTGKFEKMLADTAEKNIEILPLVRDRIKLFEKNPDDTRLDNHSLTKQMAGKYAFSVDDDVRIIYERIGKGTVRFLAIGRHPKVYTAKS